MLANPALNYAAVPAARGAAHRAACGGRDLRGLAVGSEFRRRSLRAWWDISGHSIATALVGKLLPYWLVLFTDVRADGRHPRRGAWRKLPRQRAIDGRLRHTAHRCVPNGRLPDAVAGPQLALGLSLTAIIVSPAFGYAGVGFPVTAMGWFPRAWGAILPLRWYVQILFDQASRGAPLRERPRHSPFCAA